MEDIVYEQRIELPYVYTAGAAQRAALEGLSEGRLVASSADGWTNVPAAPFGPDGRRLREFLDAPDEGVVVAATKAHHRPGAPVFALIRIDRASNVMLHRIAAQDAPQPGVRVRAVWSSERTGSILDIEHFTLVDGGASS
jgi:uncharacterized OB-fold protein